MTTGAPNVDSPLWLSLCTMYGGFAVAALSLIQEHGGQVDDAALLDAQELTARHNAMERGEHPYPIPFDQVAPQGRAIPA